MPVVATAAFAAVAAAEHFISWQDVVTFSLISITVFVAAVVDAVVDAVVAAVAAVAVAAVAIVVAVAVTAGAKQS